MSIIAIERLTRCYGPRIGVDRLDLSVPEGALFGFLGPNGSGKTTTIRVLMGLLRAGQGQARIFGRDCWREGHAIRRDVGYIPGDLRLYPWLTCKDALHIFGRMRRLDMSRTGFDLAECFELDYDVRVRAMSRGMRQKLGLILALAHEPKLLVLDEPTTALDPIVQEKLCVRLRSMSEKGHTIFFSSHSLAEVERLCDRVAILRRGRLVADEPLEALRTRAKRLVTIRWASAAAAREDAPAGLLGLRGRDGLQWRATLDGPVMELVRWCADRSIEDLTIGQPDLNSLFQSYYAEGGEEA